VVRRAGADRLEPRGERADAPPGLLRLAGAAEGERLRLRRGGSGGPDRVTHQAGARGFLPQPVLLIDVETSNWWTSTHPRSLFVTGLIVGVRGDDGTGTLLCDWSELFLSEQTPAGTSVTPLEREAIPELLATRFSLPGFPLAADGRLLDRSQPLQAT